MSDYKKIKEKPIKLGGLGPVKNDSWQNAKQSHERVKQYSNQIRQVRTTNLFP